jgi:hypothetical protein
LSALFKYFCSKNVLGFSILNTVLPSIYVNSEWFLKKSLILLDAIVRTAKVLALSKCTYLIGGGFANYGLLALITALK